MRSGFDLLVPVALSCALACTCQPVNALGTCPPNEEPNGIGECRPCPWLSTLASITSPQIGLVFNTVGIQQAYYEIVNNVGTFYITGTMLAQYNFKVPPPAAISLPPLGGSFDTGLGFSLPYQGSANIPKLDLNWPGGNSWTGDDTGVVVTALLSGEIDINLSATLNFVPISVNPTLTLTNLPVTITFGTDMAGNATVSQSQVVIAPVGSYGSVNNCGAFGWCNGLVTGPIASQVQAKLQSVIASQFASALNGQNNSSPFWVGFMNAIANSSPIQLLTDPAGYKLPLPNQSTPGGATDKWFAVGNFSYAGHSMTADFFSDGGLCYLDCTPKSQSQLCGPNGCGTIDDGCGDTVTCPGVCGTGQICTKNMCKVCVPLTCANVGTTCGPVSDGCFSTITCNKCGVGYACRNGQCVGFGGQGGQFCANCRATGGICSVRPGNTAVCIHQ